MANIYYELDGFDGPLPNGLASPSSGNHRVSMGRLVWAAATIGTMPFAPACLRGEPWRCSGGQP